MMNGKISKLYSIINGMVDYVKIECLCSMQILI